jgi:hypothetical protein
MALKSEFVKKAWLKTIIYDNQGFNLGIILIFNLITWFW